VAHSLHWQSQTTLTVSGFQRLKSEEPCIRIREVAKSETPNWRKVSITGEESQPSLNISGFDISVFSKIRSRGPLHRNSRSRETRHSFGGGSGQGFRHFTFQRLESLKT
jgi:hypothetical protein